MDEKWRALLEVIGLTTVVGSLIFVGIQIQQGAEATRSATVLQIKDAWVQVNLTHATNIELNEAYAAAREQGLENISFVQREMLDGMGRSILHNLANAYYQYRIGTLDEEQWLPHLREIESFYQAPNIKITWEKYKFLYDESFQELMAESAFRRAN